MAGCKIAVLCKNRRCGNCNAHKCALPRATLGFCTSTAQRICTISSSTDKNSCHNFVKLSAWWLAFSRYFCCGNCNAHKCALPRATLGFCTSTAQRICTISSSTDKNSCHNFVKLSAWWLAFARCFQPHTRRKPHTSNYPAVHSYTLYARTHTYIHAHMRFVIYMNYKSTMHKCQHQN